MALWDNTKAIHVNNVLPTGFVGPFVNIKQLRYVTAILSTGSFSSAAACEGVSVQAVSKAMSELEGEVGEPLFIRTSSGVSPTPLGEAFGSRANKVLAEFDSLERFVRSHDRGSGMGGRFSMGFCMPPFQEVDRYCSLVKVVAERALGCQVEVLLTNGDDCVEELRAGRFDALITVGPIKADGVVCGSLGTMAPMVVMSQDNPLAKKSELTIEDISTCPVLLAPDFEHFNESVCMAYVCRGVTSELVEVCDGEAYRTFLFDRNGLSFIMGSEFLGKLEGCVVRPIAARDRLAVPICFSTLAGSGLSYLEFARALVKMKILS